MKKDTKAMPTMCRKGYEAYGAVLKSGKHKGQRHCRKISKPKKGKPAAKPATTTTTTTTTAATVTAKPTTGRKKTKKKLSDAERKARAMARVKRLLGGRR